MHQVQHVTGGSAKPDLTMDDQFVAFPPEFGNVFRFGAAFAGRTGAGLGAYDLASSVTGPEFLDLDVRGR